MITKIKPIGIYNTEICVQWKIIVFIYDTYTLKSFLWGQEFSIISDCRALQWLDFYDVDNMASRCLQFGIIGYIFIGSHRRASFS